MRGKWAAGRVRRVRLSLPRLAVGMALAAALAAFGCGDACVGYSSFTDANGLIVFVGCDGVAFVVTPTPGA